MEITGTTTVETNTVISSRVPSNPYSYKLMLKFIPIITTINLKMNSFSDLLISLIIVFFVTPIYSFSHIKIATFTQLFHITTKFAALFRT